MLPIVLDNEKYLLFGSEEVEIISLKMMTVHKDDEAGEVPFEISEESDGTRRIMELIPALIALNNGEKVYFIDEIERSLHPTLARVFFELFHRITESKNGQLIATTHESGLLDLKLFRKDEIWFVEKDQTGASRTYSMEEFKPRYDKDIRKGYLLGRFGAVPLVKKNNKIVS